VLRSRVGSTQSEIHSLRAELEQSAELLVDSKHRAERKGAIKARIPQLESELVAYQRELDDYRATLTYIE
jgi:hypothetical protein